MIRLTKAPVPFPIGDTGLIFMLRPGSVLDRSEFEADLAELGAGQVYDMMLQQAFADGVRAVLNDRPDDANHLVELAATAADPETAGDMPVPELAALSEAKEAVRLSWPPYAQMLKQAARRTQLIPTLAFHTFCVGWEGPGLPEFARGMDGRVTAEAMEQISDVLLKAVGLRAYNMLYAPGEAKNSAPPSPSDESQAPSKSDAPAKGGSSRPAPKAQKKSGPKTRSSLSRGASSRSSTSGMTVGATAAAE